MAKRPSFSSHFLQTRLRLHHLEFLVALHEESSIVRAANRMNLAQPAATRLLKDIEQQLGVALFERSRRGVLPTEYGERTLTSARRVLAELRNLGSELSALGAGEKGRAIVGTLLGAATTLLPASLARHRSTAPGITVRVKEGTWNVLLPQLRTGEVDLVVGRVPEPDEQDGVDVTRLYQDGSVIVARPGHPLSTRPDLRLKDLLGAEWVLPMPWTMLRRDVEEAFRAAGHDAPQPAVESVNALVNQRLIGQRT